MRYLLFHVFVSPVCALTAFLFLTTTVVAAEATPMGYTRVASCGDVVHVFKTHVDPVPFGAFGYFVIFRNPKTFCYPNQCPPVVIEPMHVELVDGVFEGKSKSVKVVTSLRSSVQSHYEIKYQGTQQSGDNCMEIAEPSSGISVGN